MRRRKRDWSDDRGLGDVVAMIFILPIFFGVIMLWTFVARQGIAVNNVAHAADVGARAASRSRSPDAAGTNAVVAVNATLAGSATTCAGGAGVSVAADQWEPGGVVTVSVTCSVQRGDLAAIAAPDRSFTATSRAVIDRFRSFEETP